MKKKMSRSGPPKYFIAVKISNPQIISHVKNVQDIICKAPQFQALPILKKCCTPPERLHMTLLVAWGPGDDRRAEKAFIAGCEEISRMLAEPPQLTITGLGNFGKHVVFATLNDSDEIQMMTNLAGVFHRKFESYGFLGDDKLYKPHMTICKLNPRLVNDGGDQVELASPEMTQQFKYLEFGVEKVTKIQLLRMKIDKDTGFYSSVAEYDLDDAPGFQQLTQQNRGRTRSNVGFNAEIGSGRRRRDPIAAYTRQRRRFRSADARAGSRFSAHSEVSVCDEFWEGIQQNPLVTFIVTLTLICFIGLIIFSRTTKS